MCLGWEVRENNGVLFQQPNWNATALTDAFTESPTADIEKIFGTTVFNVTVCNMQTKSSSSKDNDFWQ